MRIPQYPPNTAKWNKGDLVLHRADAKTAKMLMRVIGYTRGGDCKTQYVNPVHKRTIWTNPVSSLLPTGGFLEQWGGYPILDFKPERCPICGSKEIETEREADEDELDDALAIAHKYDPDEDFWTIREQHPEFMYIVEECHCHNDECGAVVGYGGRHYYNPQSNHYDLPRPKTPKEIESAEHERQIRESGQRSLFEGLMPGYAEGGNPIEVIVGDEDHALNEQTQEINRFAAEFFKRSAFPPALNPNETEEQSHEHE